jgi:2,3-dihydroxybiphenyl 1,2-dioxygenase
VTRVAQLGYLGFEVSDPGAWAAFATGVLGLTVAGRGEHGALSLRLDGHAHRLFVEPGPADDVVFIGWQVDDEPAFAQAVERLRAAGVDVSLGSEGDAARRHVARLARFRDPGGVPTEIFFGPEMAAAPFRSSVVPAGFVAGDLGLGHVVIAARSQEESRAFYCDVLGFRVSDRIVAEIHGYHADMLFLHVNRRHHSVAFGARQDKNIHHFMLEVRSMDDVGLAFDRALRAGARIMHTLGRHPNDGMFSFYARTPSGFQFEVGWGGRDVDDATWEPAVHDRISEWGHHPPGFLAPLRKSAAPNRGEGNP